MFDFSLVFSTCVWYDEDTEHMVYFRSRDKQEEDVMLNMLFGIGLLAGAAVLLVMYRPKERESWETWGICVLLGLFSVMLSDGSVVLQVIEHGAQIVAFFSCLCTMHREKVRRARRKTMRGKNVASMQAPEEKVKPFCA